MSVVRNNSRKLQNGWAKAFIRANPASLLAFLVYKFSQCMNDGMWWNARQPTSTSMSFLKGHVMMNYWKPGGNMWNVYTALHALPLLPGVGRVISCAHCPAGSETSANES